MKTKQLIPPYTEPVPTPPYKRLMHGQDVWRWAAPGVIENCVFKTGECSDSPEIDITIDDVECYLLGKPLLALKFGKVAVQSKEINAAEFVAFDDQPQLVALLVQYWEEMLESSEFKRGAPPFKPGPRPVPSFKEAIEFLKKRGIPYLD